MPILLKNSGLEQVAVRVFQEPQANFPLMDWHQIALLFLSILPGILLSWYIYWRDKHEPEPKHYMVAAFVLGMAATYPAIKMEEFGMHELGIFVSESWLMTFAFAFWVIAFSEELVKFLFLRYVFYPRKEFDEPMDGIVYAVMIGMGFATLENVLYVSLRGGGFDVAILRMFTAIPAHGAFAVWMGYFVGMAKFSNYSRTKLLLIGLGLAILIHGIYDFFLFQKNAPALVVVTFITLGVSVLMSKRLIALHVAQSLQRQQSQSSREQL